MSYILRSLCAGVAGLAAALPAGAAGAAPSVEPELTCGIGYSWQQLSRTRYAAAIEIRNTGGAVINGWTLRFDLPPPQQVVVPREASFDTMSGAIVARNVKTNGLVEPANAVTIGYVAIGQGATLEGFSVNGVACTAVAAGARQDRSVQ